MNNVIVTPFSRATKLSLLDTFLISSSGLIFIFAPFTWTYLASFLGFLLRPVDVAIFLVLFLMFIRGKLILNLGPVPVLLALLAIGMLLQFMLRGGSDYFFSSLKIFYYLSMSMCIATAMRLSLDRPTPSYDVAALILGLPMYAMFFIALTAHLSEISLTLNFSSLFDVTRSMWHSVFSENLFVLQIDLDVTGVEFRNSAGIAFLVAGLFFSLSPTPIGRLLVIFFMILAASLFSRSVWALQFLYLSLLLFASTPRLKVVWFVGAVAVVLGMLAFDGLREAIETRALSNFGRTDSWFVAVNSLDQNFLWGVLGGERVLLPDGEIKAVHNVPLALGLKAGVFFLLLSMIAQLWFLLTSLRAMKALFARPQYGSSHLVVLIVVSLLLFIRPLLSASHSVYFSIGEWCALGLFLALSTSVSDTQTVRRSDH